MSIDFCTTCPKRCYQVGCYCDQCGISCRDYCKNCGYLDKDHNYDFLEELFNCCCKCICILPFACFSVVCCNFGKSSYSKIYNSSTKTLSFENKTYVPVTLTYGDIPQECEIIDFANVCNLEIKSKLLCCFMKNIFPQSIKQILNLQFNNSEILLPKNLEYISIFYKNVYRKQNFFPPSVKTIKLYNKDAYEHIKKELFPLNLEVLILEGNFIIDDLPENLIELRILCKLENYSILNNLPFSLKVLELYFLERNLSNLPVGLENLIIKHCMTKLKNKLKIPFGCNLHIN